MGKGSLVENEKEKQKKGLEIATKMPNGALIGVHAQLINNLIYLANKLENKGKKKEAIIVDKYIKKISYFSSYKYKQPGIFNWMFSSLKLPILGVGLFSVLKLFGHKLSSMKENLKKDLNDLHDLCIDYSDRSKSAGLISQLINPYLKKINNLDLSSKKDSYDYVNILNEFESILLNKIKNLVLTFQQDIKERSNMFSKIYEWGKNILGFEDFKILKSSYEDCVESFKEAKLLAQKIGTFEETVNKKIESTNANIEMVLDNTFLGKKYDNLEELENDLNSIFTKLYESNKIDKHFSIDIVRDNKLLDSPEKIIQIMKLLEKKVNS
jgi:hypothetical protein